MLVIYLSKRIFLQNHMHRWNEYMKPCRNSKNMTQNWQNTDLAKVKASVIYVKNRLFDVLLTSIVKYFTLIHNYVIKYLYIHKNFIIYTHIIFFFIYPYVFKGNFDILRGYVFFSV